MDSTNLGNDEGGSRSGVGETQNTDWRIALLQNIFTPGGRVECDGGKFTLAVTWILVLVATVLMWLIHSPMEGAHFFHGIGIFIVDICVTLFLLSIGYIATCIISKVWGGKSGGRYS